MEISHLCKIRERPNGPNLTRWCIVTRDESENRLEASVVDISLSIQAPPFNCHEHSVKNIFARRRLNRPRIGAI